MNIKTLTCRCTAVGIIDTDMFDHIEGTVSFTVSCPNCFQCHLLQHEGGVFTLAMPELVETDLEFEMELISFNNMFDDILVDDIMLDNIANDEFDEVELDWSMGDVYQHRMNTLNNVASTLAISGPILIIIALFIYGVKNG